MDSIESLKKDIEILERKIKDLSYMKDRIKETVYKMGMTKYTITGDRLVGVLKSANRSQDRLA